MTTSSFDWPQSAVALLDQAKRQGDVVKLIMAGTEHIDSWLIEQRILPFLFGQQLGILRFSMAAGDAPPRKAALAPLPDGSAFFHDTSGIWGALAVSEAVQEIQHIGLRFAPADQWQTGFSACFQLADAEARPLKPLEVARQWHDTTRIAPKGFDEGRLDRVAAFGLDAMEKLLKTHGRLGL